MRQRLAQIRRLPRPSAGLVMLGAGLCLVLPLQAETALQRGPGGETICAPRAKLLARLEHGRDFSGQGQGLRDAEAMIELRADPEGNWLLLQNYADGLTCLMAMGEAWESAAPPAAMSDVAAPARDGGAHPAGPGPAEKDPA